MTEEQAQRTRCCGPEGCGFTRKVKRADAPHDEIVVRFCIGSACMAWRGGLWERVDRPAAMGIPDGDGWVKDGQESGLGGAVTNRQQWKREQFFCGLAGRP